MAYNPFDFFRRNQKVFFGGLTILVMFMFILSFGQGDFFSRFPQWVAKFQTHGDVMAKIDGAAIKESQLRDVANERNLANGYMLAANAKSLDAAAKKARKEATAATSETLRQQLDQDVALIDNRLLPRRLPAEVWPLFRAEIDRLASDLRALQESTPKSEDKQRVQAVRVYAEVAVADLNRRMSGDRGENGVYFANQPNRNQRDQLEFLLWKKKADRLGIRYTQEDVIRLVDGEFPPDSIPADDLKAMATDTAAKAGKSKTELYEALADEFRVRAAQTAVMGVNPVRFPAAPPAGTTRERYEHFVNETTATKYTMLTVPVEAYLTEVDRKIAAKEMAGPTEAELTEIFNKASNIDPNPASATPGVREPRKVGVQWVEVTGEEEYYKTLAAKRGAEFQQVKGSPAAQAVLGVTIPPAQLEARYDNYLAEQGQVNAYRHTRDANPGRPKVGNGLLAAVGGGLMADPESSYFGPEMLPKFPSMKDRQDRLTDAEFVRPELAAALAGLTASALATNAPLFAPITAVTETAFRQTREQRAVAGIQAFQFPTLGGPSLLADAVGGAVAMTAATPAPLPQAAVDPVLALRTVENLRTEVANEDVQAFQKELTRITGQKLEGAKKADRAAQEKAEREHRAKLAADAKKYADEWIAARKLKTGGTAEPRSIHELADDPGLTPLLQKDFLVTDFGGKPRNSRAATSFGQAFVSEMDLGQAPGGGGIQARLRPVSGLYQPKNYDPMGGRGLLQQIGAGGQEYAPFGGFFAQLSVAPGRPLTMTWRTAEVDPVRPLSLTSGKETRDRCVAIWKLNKARDLARQAADQAAETIRKNGTSEVQLGQGATEAADQLKKQFDPKSPAYARFQVFYQEPQFTVAKLLVGPDSGPDTPPELVAFNPTHRSMVYESDKLREELVAKKDAPLGTTFVVTDQPQTTLYLLVVAGRDQKGDHLFRDHILYPPGKPPVNAPVLSGETLAPRFATYAADADRKVAVALLKAEFKYKDENPKLDEKKE
jgi:hypothetical protein